MKEQSLRINKRKFHSLMWHPIPKSKQNNTVFTALVWSVEWILHTRQYSYALDWEQGLLFGYSKYTFGQVPSSVISTLVVGTV